jgi:hypothetical protein
VKLNIGSDLVFFLSCFISLIFSFLFFT